MCVHGQAALTEACLASLFKHEAGERFEVVIVDNGSDSETNSCLRRWAMSRDEVKVFRSEINLNFALGSNVGFEASRGARVVFLNNDTEVSPEWLRSLLRPLRDPSVKGAQPKLVYPDGTIQGAGVVFSSYSPLGYPIYVGKPGDYVPTQKARRYRALTAACMAIRAVDFANAEGFDTDFINGQEDIDLCLRVGKGEAVFAFVPDAVVLHHEGKTPGRGTKIENNRRLFFQRWNGIFDADDTQYYEDDNLMPEAYAPDNPAWVEHGYAIWRPIVAAVEGVGESNSSPLKREDLQIAIKIGCPDRAIKDHWGDYHFAVALCSAFLRKGVRARIDFLSDWYANKDDDQIVNLVLRGISRYDCHSGPLNLMWLISHPDKVSLEELKSFDYVLAASELWVKSARSEGISCEALLQCSDVCRFLPSKEVAAESFRHLYVANSRLVKRTAVAEAIEQDVTLDIFGEMWDGIAPMDWVKGEQIDNVDLPGFYSSAEVVVNDHWDAMKKQGFISNRIFDVLACGGIWSPTVPQSCPRNWRSSAPFLVMETCFRKLFELLRSETLRNAGWPLQSMSGKITASTIVPTYFCL
ncbi:hypothetical protein ACO34A_05010 [Rhizobium sp. ACO-34A]|nr:hypothetical protein ACO34A_05010 [Rhizobium sp. ACO-34A]